MRPDEVTESLGIQPSFAEVSYVARCDTGRKEECGLWSYDTAKCISSDDIRDHIEHLLRTFLPLKNRIDETRPLPKVFVHVRCQPPSLLRPERAPRIEANHISGLAALNAALTVEITRVASA